MSRAQQETERRLRRARRRITVITSVCLLAVLVGGAMVVLNVYRADLIGQVDSQLETSAERLNSLVASGSVIPSVATPDDRVQVIDRDAHVVYASPSLVGDGPLWAPGQPTEPHTVPSSSLGSSRIIVTEFLGRSLVFITPLRTIDQDVDALRNAMLIALPPLVLLLGLVVWLAVGRALRPVAAAARREERLVADVSHELRSPIAGLRVLLETEPDPGEGPADRSDALTLVNRLETISDQLLQLARQDEAATSVGRPVDLDEVVQHEVERLTVRTTCRIDTFDVVAGQVSGNQQDLESMVGNLVGNAVRHAHDLVRVAVTEDDGMAVLTVEDDGPGIAPEQRELVFERFTRLDESRSRDVGGAGLGLAIVRAVVEAHDGAITADDSPIGGARFTVRIPATTRDDGEPVEGLNTVRAQAGRGAPSVADGDQDSIADEALVGDRGRGGGRRDGDRRGNDDGGPREP